MPLTDLGLGSWPPYCPAKFRAFAPLAGVLQCLLARFSKTQLTLPVAASVAYVSSFGSGMKADYRLTKPIDSCRTLFDRPHTAKPQATASVRPDLQALAGQSTPTEDDEAMRRPVLQTAKSQLWF